MLFVKKVGDIIMTFGERLRKLRTEKGITQAQLGNIIGVSDRVVGYYESDDRFPKDDVILKKMADYFNISLDELLNRDTINEPIQIAASTKDGLDLSNMSEKDRQVIIDMYNLLKSKNKDKSE